MCVRLTAPPFLPSPSDKLGERREVTASNTARLCPPDQPCFLPVPAVAPELGGGNLLHPFPPSVLYLEALGHLGTQKTKILVSDSQTFLLRREKAWGVFLFPDIKVP